MSARPAMHMQMRWQVPESALTLTHAFAMNTSTPPRPLFLILLAAAVMALGVTLWREIAVDPSAYRIGLALDKRGLHKLARPVYLHAAQHGDGRAQVNLGALYQDGKGGRTDYQAALHWYGQAARQELPLANYNLGVMHLEGLGTPASHKRAAEFFLRAALKGDLISAYNLGQTLLEGRGDQPRDTEGGLRWLRFAADRGDLLAMFALGWRHEEGAQVPAAPAEAMRWYGLAASRGYPDAQVALVRMRLKQQAKQFDLGDNLGLLDQARRSPGQAQAAQNVLASLCATYPEADCRANGRFPPRPDKPLRVAWRPPTRDTYAGPTGALEPAEP